MEINATRIDESLAKGIVKRLLREGYENSRKVKRQLREAKRAGKGKQSIGVRYRRRCEAVRRSMGDLYISEFGIVRPLRGGWKDVGRAYIGMDTHGDKPPEGDVTLIMMHVVRKTGIVDIREMRVVLSIHVLERIVMREQIMDTKHLTQHMQAPVWHAIVVSIDPKLEQGRYLVASQDGMSIVLKGPDKAILITWIVPEQWGAEQNAFYDAHYDDKYSCILTRDTQLRQAGQKPALTRVVDASMWSQKNALLVEY